jgi:hypothetical protein
LVLSLLEKIGVQHSRKNPALVQVENPHPGVWLSGVRQKALRR